MLKPASPVAVLLLLVVLLVVLTVGEWFESCGEAFGNTRPLCSRGARGADRQSRAVPPCGLFAGDVGGHEEPG